MTSANVAGEGWAKPEYSRGMSYPAGWVFASAEPELVDAGHGLACGRAAGALDGSALACARESCSCWCHAGEVWDAGWVPAPADAEDGVERDLLVARVRHDLERPADGWTPLGEEPVTMVRRDIEDLLQRLEHAEAQLSGVTRWGVRVPNTFPDRRCQTEADARQVAATLGGVVIKRVGLGPWEAA